MSLPILPTILTLELARPRTFDFTEYGDAIGSLSRVASEAQYVVDPDGVFRAGRDVRAMLTAPGDDVILFKIAYWLGR